MWKTTATSCHRCADAKLGTLLALWHESSRLRHFEQDSHYEEAALIHKNSSIHSYFRQLYIGKTWRKNPEKSPPKKSSLFSILFFLEYHCCTAKLCQDRQLFSLCCFEESGSVLPLAVVEPTSLCSRTNQLCRVPKIRFRWWVGIDKLGWIKAQGCITPTTTTGCLSSVTTIKQVKRLS